MRPRRACELRACCLRHCCPHIVMAMRPACAGARCGAAQHPAEQRRRTEAGAQRAAAAPAAPAAAPVAAVQPAVQHLVLAVREGLFAPSGVARAVNASELSGDLTGLLAAQHY
eukprot:gene30084-3316_t